MNDGWREVGRNVFLRRHSSFDVNSGLVIGAEQCLVIDTLSTARQAMEMISAIRAITDKPWTIVNTHAHFDHCFGNASFRPAAIWGHPGCAEELRNSGSDQRRTAQEMAPELFADLEKVVIDPPDHLVTNRHLLDIGGRTVEVIHPGRGHTDHDLVVRIPDADVLFAGDLVEQGAPPSVEDSYPLEWPGTMAALLPMATGVVVPGHGDTVDREFIERQAEQLQQIADHALGREGALPDFPPQVLRTALQRATWERRTRPR